VTIVNCSYVTNSHGYTVDVSATYSIAGVYRIYSFEGALVEYQKSLGIKVRVVGYDHPDVALLFLLK